MIDYVKIMNLPVFVSDIIKNPLLNFETKIIEETGELLNKPKVAEYQGLIFKLKKNKLLNKYQYVNLEGSLHKYWNNGEHNYNDFNFNNLVNVIIDLSEKFNIDSLKTRLNNLEFGVNLILPFNPDIFLKSMINHKGKQFSIQRQKNKHFRECEHTRYYFKIYNKGLQYGQNNILRIEIKIIRMEQLKKIEINYLSDLLNYNKYLLLGTELRTYYNDLLMFDNRVPIEGIKQRERLILADGINPQYWENLKILNPNNYYKKRNRFIELSEKYGANEIKNVVYQLLDKKIKELSEVKPETLLKLTAGKNQKITVINRSNKGLIPSLPLQPEKRLCTITKINISNQKERSNFLSENTIFQLFLNDFETYLNLENEYLSNSKRKLSIKNKCYYIAHNIRNIDSNKRNNLIRKINKYDDKETLFNTLDLLQLDTKQKKILNNSKIINYV